MANSLVHTRHRRNLLYRIGHRLVGFVAVAGWVAMPLMPVLALAYTWFSKLS